MKKKDEQKLEEMQQEIDEAEAAQEDAAEGSEEEAPEEAASEGAAMQEEIEALKGQVEKLTGDLQEKKDRLLRLQADFDNFRRRNEGVRADAFAEGQRKVATAMLPVLDNLERALAAAENADADALKTGVEMTRKQMVAAYEKLGVTPIDRLGEKFDPNLEEAIMQGTADDGEPGTVCMVLQKGYMMDKTVLRHAMVKVVPD